MIYTGQEVGLKKRLSFFEKDVVASWLPNLTTVFYKKMNELKHTHPALRAGESGGKPRFYTSSASKDILIYSREIAGKELLVMLNLSGKNITYTSNDALNRSNYTDYLSEQKVDKLPTSLKPYEYKIFTR